MLKLCQCCCRGIVCNHCRPPCCPLLFLSESLCDYRVQGRWGLTWINKGLWSRGGSDVTCPADAKKHRCTRSKAQLPFLFTFNRHHHWDRMMPRLMLKWITTRLQAREAALLCKAAEKDLKDFKGVFFFFFLFSLAGMNIVRLTAHSSCSCAALHSSLRSLTRVQMLKPLPNIRLSPCRVFHASVWKRCIQ